jgi:hypothetical protein
VEPCYHGVVPTVHREEGFRFFFFSNEGDESPHVHVERGDGYAKFWLAPISLADASGMKAPELAKARSIISENRTRFEERYNEYFGS